MRGFRRLKVVVLTLVVVPFLMGASCSSKDIRNAATTGLLSYVSGTTSSALDSLMPLSEAFANLFAGPTGAQDQ